MCACDERMKSLISTEIILNHLDLKHNFKVFFSSIHLEFFVPSSTWSHSFPSPQPQYKKFRSHRDANEHTPFAAGWHDIGLILWWWSFGCKLGCFVSKYSLGGALLSFASTSFKNCTLWQHHHSHSKKCFTPPGLSFLWKHPAGCQYYSLKCVVVCLPVLPGLEI